MAVNQTAQIDDPMEAAMKAEFGPRAYFGQMAVDTYFCALVKGVGKVQFDPNQHSQDQRCTAINMSLEPMLRDNTNGFLIERSLIAESKDWASVIKPSLKALSRDLRSMNGAWVQVQLVPTGTFRNKNGEEKTRSMFKFLAIYGSQAECKAAAEASWSGHQPASSEPTPPPSNGNGNDAEKITASKFLLALWASSGKDVTKFADMIAKNPLVARHFTIESPEVIAIVSQ